MKIFLNVRFRKPIKACQGKGRGALLVREWLRHSKALSLWESGCAVPFPPQDSAVRVNLSPLSHSATDTPGRCPHHKSTNYFFNISNIVMSLLYEFFISAILLLNSRISIWLFYIGCLFVWFSTYWVIITLSFNILNMVFFSSYNSCFEGSVCQVQDLNPLRGSFY